MNKIIVIIVVVGIGWYGSLLYKKHGLEFVQKLSTGSINTETEKCTTEDGRVIYGDVPQGSVCIKLEAVKGSLTVVPGYQPDKKGPEILSSFNNSKKENSGIPNIKCDGRVYCSQMESCEEATFFLNNCPGVKMDGNNDGVPCERQWCR